MLRHKPYAISLCVVSPGAYISTLSVILGLRPDEPDNSFVFFQPRRQELLI